MAILFHVWKGLERKITHWEDRSTAGSLLFCSSPLHQFCPLVSLRWKAMEKEKKRLAEMCHTWIALLFVHVRKHDCCRDSSYDFQLAAPLPELGDGHVCV